MDESRSQECSGTESADLSAQRDRQAADMAAIKAREARVRSEIEAGGPVVDVGPFNMAQLGLTVPVVDRAGRLWRFDGTQLVRVRPETPAAMVDALTDAMLAGQGETLTWIAPDGLFLDGMSGADGASVGPPEPEIGVHTGGYDWPPAESAIGLAEGLRRRGSTGQLWAVMNGRWVRVLGNV